MHDDLPIHLRTLHRALQDEQRAEAEATAALAALSEEAQIEAGFAWPPLRVESVERRGRRHQLTLRADRGVVLHEGIGAGDPVSVDGERGLATAAEGAVAEILIEGRPAAVGARVRITRRHDPATFVRFRQGLEQAAAVDTALRRVLLGEASQPAFDAPPLDDPRLDTAQQRAAGHALAAPHLAVIHGPPGTGKTRLLVSVIDALVARGERPWALADSNVATDHLAVRCAEAGLRVVRLGHPARMGSGAAALSLDAQVAASPLARPLAVLERQLSRAWGRPEARALLRERRELLEAARAHVLDSAEVVACTLGTLAWQAPRLRQPTTAVIDEATQATEPAVWAAVPWIQRLILVGDPHQLGPVSRVPGSVLEASLLQRLVDQGALPLPMLEVQHRMRAPIRELVADVYGPSYRDHPSVAGAVLPQLPDAPASLWVDTAGAELSEQRDETTRSLYNPGEARAVASAVEALLQAGVAPGDVGVITPYSAQVACLRRQPALAGIEIATVNAFQGREKEAIAVSWVRSSASGELGFVADARRLTVALTRARRWLLSVGDSATLSAHPRFASLIETHELQGTLASIWEPPWSDALL